MEYPDPSLPRSLLSDHLVLFLVLSPRLDCLFGPVFVGTVEALEGPGVAPVPVQFLPLQGAVAQVAVVHVRYLQLPALGRLDGADVLEDRRVVEVEAGDGVGAAGLD